MPRTRVLILLTVTCLALFLASASAAGGHAPVSAAGATPNATHLTAGGGLELFLNTLSALGDDSARCKAAGGTIYVYITNTGKKYHRGGCRYLSHSKRKIPLKQAKSRGYTPCRVCKPPR